MADPGGGSRGSGPPPFGPRCRLFNIGPKVGPPPFVNVQEWGCFSIFLRANDVTRTMSKGGGALVNVQEWGCFSNFLRSDDVTWRQCPRGGVLVKNPVSAPGPPPFKNPGSAPEALYFPNTKGQYTTGMSFRVLTLGTRTRGIPFPDIKNLYIYVLSVPNTKGLYSYGLLFPNSKGLRRSSLENPHQSFLLRDWCYFKFRACFRIDVF